MQELNFKDIPTLDRIKRGKEYSKRRALVKKFGKQKAKLLDKIEELEVELAFAQRGM